MTIHQMYEDFNLLSSLYFENKWDCKTNILNDSKEFIIDLYELYNLKEDLNFRILVLPENKEIAYYKMNKDEILNILIEAPNSKDLKDMILKNLLNVMKNNTNMINLPYEYRNFLENIADDKDFISEILLKKITLDFDRCIDKIIDDISFELSKIQIEVELLEIQYFETMEDLIGDIINP